MATGAKQVIIIIIIISVYLWMSNAAIQYTIAS